jgi:hypothetical protein
VSPSPRDLLGLPLMAPRALQAAGDFLDKVPGLSAERAEQRAEEIRAAGRDPSSPPRQDDDDR